MKIVSADDTFPNIQEQSGRKELPITSKKAPDILWKTERGVIDVNLIVVSSLKVSLVSPIISSVF